ncbi:MAG: sodium:calcium antiporter [Euryarchaeota archaeon]|nr:sodium:calcium antiporter [Euryarchaeota archaeon]MBT4803218.1 sodium:calcium antiporter [Euryarchaeota archaeon]MBT5613862.1 sodium:calcium antiporter [Euryarchaeota archaeon]MBT6874457.1 sodium:calcium antiporter [Euryarchaeota archaeon]MBT7412893.1 sodium:calcium antiporter [Euryarchaeota archaeon]
MLISGAEVFVQGAVTLATKLNIPPLLVGFTIVAIGTSLPELAVVLKALDEGTPDIAIGGIVGSNISNVMLVLGTAAILGASESPGRGIRRDAMAVLVATLILVIATLYGEITLFIGLFMLILLVTFYAYSYNHVKNLDIPKENPDSWLANNSFSASIALLSGGLMVMFGANLLMEGVEGIMVKYSLNQSVIGLTIIALGTSLPEFAVTVISALRGQGGVALGNVLGSNVMNILGILGIAAIYGGGIIIDSSFAERDIWILLFSSGLVCAMLFSNKEIGKEIGFTMVIGYVIYLFFVVS